MDDKESFINNHEKAPLIELDDFSCPSAPNSFYVQTYDNKKIRIALWNQESNKGTILLQSGRTEFIEKYYEVIQELLDRDYCIAMFDWRGQGLSDRLTKDIHLGHVNKFSEYDHDLNEIFDIIISARCPSPFIGMGHSMGGCLMASFASKENNPLKALILCAPMLNIKISPFMKLIISIIGHLSWLGFRDFSLKRPEWENKKGWHEISFEDNNVTSDKSRYERTANLIRAEEGLAVGGISIGWSHEAFSRCNNQNMKWAQSITIPTLLLSANKDQLIDSRSNILLCSHMPNHKIIEINGEHELLMEVDEIREECWQGIDGFLKTL